MFMMPGFPPAHEPCNSVEVESHLNSLASKMPGLISINTCMQIAAAAVKILKDLEPGLEMNGEKLAFDTSSGQVQLFIGNLTPEWTDDSEFYSGMEQYGSVERAFVMRNIEGASKVRTFSLCLRKTFCSTQSRHLWFINFEQLQGQRLPVTASPDPSLTALCDLASVRGSPCLLSAK